jgi:hypothetical protein
MKKCSTSLIIIEMQIQKHSEIPLHTVHTAMIKTTNNNKYLQMQRNENIK